LWLEEVRVPDPKEGEVLIRVEATPINPSDLVMLVGPADLNTLAAGGTPERPTATAEVPKARLGSVAGRLDQALTVGNEGAGTVIAAGPDAQQWVGEVEEVEQVALLIAGAGGVHRHVGIEKSNRSNRSSNGVSARTGCSSSEIGFGKLSRLRFVTVSRPQLRSMNFRIET
jgi:NADPH:quinone reductase-like Zn-dependent oxidoreductase